MFCILFCFAGFAFGVPQIHPAFIQRPYGWGMRGLCLFCYKTTPTYYMTNLICVFPLKENIEGWLLLVDHNIFQVLVNLECLHILLHLRISLGFQVTEKCVIDMWMEKNEWFSNYFTRRILKMLHAYVVSLLYTYNTKWNSFPTTAFGSHNLSANVMGVNAAASEGHIGTLENKQHHENKLTQLIAQRESCVKC